AGESGRPQDGAGSGSAITRAILQISGGTSELDSTPGQGSCFRVRSMSGHVAGYRETSAAARRVIGYEGHRRSVSVTDDDPEQRALMRRVLEGIGFEVTSAPDGATASASSDARAFDLVSLDVSMPGSSGWEVAARSRRTRDHSMGVIMLSANAHERHGPDTGARDHDSFSVKPIEFGASVDAIGARSKSEWIYEGDGPAEVGGSPASPSSEAAREHVEKLRESSRIGPVRGMEAEIRKLDAAQPDARESVEASYNCSDRASDMDQRPIRRDTVLVVDDKADSSRSSTDTSEAGGITVSVATSGAAASDSSGHVVPDSVSMDAVMPGMDGFETTARIKANP
ncbi:hypothetical protein OY671_007967, partial [Metschnikowia pulcherrima]